MIKHITYIFSFLLLTPLISHSQEALFELGSNPLIRQAYLDGQTTHPSAQTSINRAPSDTISLPFFDDFAKTALFPNNELWLDSFAFINPGFAFYPPSIGMATLEGLSKDGMPYEFTFNQPHDKADELTSRWIDLSGFTPADSLYFSFYYQPQGLGNAPETEDSLVLQFKYKYLDTSNVAMYDWKSVWKMAGTGIQSDSLFTQVMLPVADTIYFYNGFQFRFVNYATLSGNVDHWHIDYVYFDESRFKGDTAYDDGAFTRPMKSLLRDYQAIPWSHYTANPTDATGDIFTFKIHNFFSGSSNISFLGNIYGPDNANLKTLTAGTPVNVDPFTYCGNEPGDDCIASENSIFDNTLDFDFPTTYSGSEVDFRFAGILAGSNTDTRLDNDSVFYTQKFHSYYAYDDGSAENAYGLLQAGGQLAYRFALRKADTLKAIQIYFNPVLDDVSDKKFQLAVWTGGLNGPQGNPIYLSDSLYSPTYFPGFYNGFYTYLLDKPVPVSDTIFVGWVQVEGELLNIGLDRGINANKHMFFSLSNGASWTTSNLKGAWMMRPLFGNVQSTIGIEETSLTPQFNLFPNPTEDILNISNSINDDLNKYRLKVFDSTGRLILTEENLPSQLELHTLKPGFYMFHITAKSGAYSHTYKIVVK